LSAQKYDDEQDLVEGQEAHHARTFFLALGKVAKAAAIPVNAKRRVTVELVW